MKAQILKIAGVKNEKEFYKKFPTEAAFMKKHGKALKKAQVGIEIPDDALNPQMPTDYEAGNLDNIGQQAFGGIGSFIGGGLNLDGKKGFDWDSLGLGNIGSDVAAAFNDSQANSTYNKKLDQYLGISDLIGKTKPEKKQIQKYIRPEDQLVAAANPKGIAQNGAMIGGNPTEIQNMYNIGDIYTDLEDSNVKQYGWGGELANLNAGWNNNGVTGQMSPGWQSATKIAKKIPLVGNIVEFAGQTQANEQAGMLANKQAQFFNNLTGSAISNLNSGQFAANVKHGGAFHSMKDGGWMSHDWQPQVITKFGDYSVKDLLKPDPTMDTLRAGGHLHEYTPPSAQALETFGDGGELQTLWGGDIKEVGVNPIIGKLGMLSGGYHSQRAADAPGQTGIGMKFGENVIEAENGEGVAMLANGGKIDPATGKPSKSAYIFGAEKIQGWAKKAIEDEDIKIGTTFKHYFDTKSKLQKKLNKQELKAKEESNNLDVDSPYDQLKANSIIATLKGVQMQNRDIAKHIANAAAVQTAINDTDEEMGTAKYGGVLKKAAFGAKMTTAQKGINLNVLDPSVAGLVNLLQKKGYNIVPTSGKRSGRTSSGNASRHNSGEAIDIVFPKLGSKAYKTLIKDPDVVKYMMDNGLTAINEYDSKVRSQTGGTGPHIHFGKDTGTGLADRFRNAVSSTWEGLKGITGEASDFISDNFGTPQVKKNVSDLIKTSKAKKAEVAAPKKQPLYVPPVAKSTPANLPVSVGSPQLGLTPIRSSTDDLLDKLNNDLLTNPNSANLNGVPQYANTKSLASPAIQLPTDGLVGRLNDITQNLQGYQSPAIAQQIQQLPVEDVQPIPALEPIQKVQAIDEVQPIVQQQAAMAQQNNPEMAQQDQQSSVAPTSNSSSKWKEGLESFGNNLKGFGNLALNNLQSALPQLRPSNQRPFDPQALTGEMFALATNQLEPVQAQKFVPYLSQGIQVSLQDQLNEVTAQTRAAERMAKGNPEALAMIAAQAYDAKNRIKGEEFRLNQQEKQRVAETNRQVLNEANKMNLGIMDQQYVRQQTAKSKTKEQAITALNSISEKILQNKLENKKLGIYENLYNYRFGPNGQAYNVNDTVNFNTPDVGYGAYSANQIPAGTTAKQLRALADLQEESDKKATKKTVARNGAIVKAIKDL